MIHVINIAKEDYSFSPNYYYIGRSKTGNVLGNPYSHLPSERCLAIYRCKSVEEAVNNYSIYFDAMYGHNMEFTKIVDEIYEKYKNGEEIYLGCWCNDENKCHGGVIKKKLQQRLIKEKIREHKVK